MTISKTNPNKQAPRPDGAEESASGPPPEPEYDSATKPLMMLVVPFVLILIYAYFN